MGKNILRNIEKIKVKVLPILTKYKVVEAGIFGSIAHGDYRPDSDIDFLMRFPANSGISLLEIAGLKVDLEEALGRKVDLVEYDYIKARLKKNIHADEIKILKI